MYAFLLKRVLLLSVKHVCRAVSVLPAVKHTDEQLLPTGKPARKSNEHICSYIFCSELAVNEDKYVFRNKALYKEIFVATIS
jgi:hypothetical protein